MSSRSKQFSTNPPISLQDIERRLEEIEQQIHFYHKTVDFDVKEYPIEIIVDKYQPKNPNETSDTPPEFIIPDYQREYTWDDYRASKFIESIFIGLPIPYMTFAESLDVDEGELEIVDGSQRVRALTRYLRNELQLSGLTKLESLNGTYFRDLPIARQRKFNRSTIRIIVLTENADEEARRDLFERINTGSDPLNDMERRRGSFGGQVIQFVEELAQLPISQRLLKVSQANAARREKEEFVLRFIVYSDRYQLFNKSVRDFLDAYIKEKNDDWTDIELCEKEQKKISDDYNRVLEFVEEYFENGFCVPKKNTVPRIRFEALAVGINLALQQNSNLVPGDLAWVTGDELKKLTTSDGSNSRPRVIERIEFVRNKLLAQQIK